MRGIHYPKIALAAILASTALVSPALAQEASILPFPVRQYTDENGVDLLSGVFTAYSPGIRIGSDEMGLGYVRAVRGPIYRDDTMGTISFDGGSTYTVAVGGSSELFTLSGSVFTPVEQNGSTLSLSGTTYTYTKSDGTVVTFQTASYSFGNAAGTSIATLTYPSGRSLTYHYVTATYTDTSGNPVTGRRLQSVTTNAGYHMKLSYQSDTVTSSSGASTWSKMSKVKGLNSATDSCSVTAFSCPQAGRPELTIPASTLVSGTITQTYIDSENRTTTYTLTGPLGQKNVTGIQLPGSTANDISVTYTSGRVTSITRFGVTTSYSSSDSGNVRTVTVTRPGSATRVATFDITNSVMLTDRDELNRTTSYLYDTENRVIRITRPEGYNAQPERDYTQFKYDARGNIIEQQHVSKTPGTPLDIVTRAKYPDTCTITNAVKCNKPETTTDARGNTTTYTYDDTHGGLLTVTAPEPTTNAVQPQTRISYSRLDSNGISSTTGIFRPTGISACQTGSATGSAPSCVATADEVRTTIAYGQGLQPSAVSQGAGDNSLIATTTITYDAVGNLLTVDGPLPDTSNTSDKSRYRYNLNRELTGWVSADPDLSGSGLKHRAVRVTYRPDGQVSKQEIGTVDSQSDTHWAAFAPLETVDIGYSSKGLPLTWKLSGGAAATMTQVSYDSRGRPECSAVRMNASAYGSLPSSACILTTEGSFGPDRITKTIYNAANEVTEVRVNVATAAESSDRTMTYTSNGRLQTLTDGENNRTTYEYDGHDRLSKTRYPVATKGANSSSTTDYEQLTYDAGSNIYSRLTRSGDAIDYRYDALNRLTIKGGVTVTDVNFGYDNLGRLITAAHSNGQGITNAYDALGRLTSSSSNMGAVTRATSYEYDLAGRRTKLTYADSGLYVNYDYLVTGEVARIRENGAISEIGVLATYAYDNLGRRTSLTFGNGTSQVFDYDAISRLSSLTAMTGTANDLTVSSIAYNPANQITSQVRSNDAYAWNGAAAFNRPYTSNGLNQYTQSGPFTLKYEDDRGNLTSDGITTYGYSPENRLVSATGGTSASLVYDPHLRLYQLTSGTVTTRFGYDGLDMIAEYNGSNALLRRYVHGPGMDQPIVWYEGTGTTDRRFLHTDERGSVIATTDGSGNLLAANNYDEYGIPGVGNIGRFQYTGQVWLPELEMYYYKNRIYSPSLGRFLQTDPIGVEGGINLYAYVLSDPINLIDPLGLDPATCENPTPDGCGTIVVQGGLGVPGTGGRGGINSLTGLPWLAKRVGEGSCAPDSAFEYVRGFLETGADIADGVTVGSAAVGAAPVAAAAKTGGAIIEGALGALNLVDCGLNGNCTPLTAQVASLPSRLVPGGRIASKYGGMENLIRNAKGQFRKNHQNTAKAIDAGAQAVNQRAVNSAVAGGLGLACGSVQ